MDKSFAVFDLDGTLIDSMGYWGRICSGFLLSYGIAEDAEYLTQATDVMTIPESIEWMIRTYGLPCTAEETEPVLCGKVRELYRTTIPAKKSVDKYLAGLTRRGVQMCVASASPKEDISNCLERLHLKQYFSFLLSCEEVGEGKTSPAIFLTAAARFKTIPKNIAVFEDSLVALNTAKNAGFYTIAVYDQNADTNWSALSELAEETISDWDFAE